MRLVTEPETLTEASPLDACAAVDAERRVEAWMRAHGASVLRLAYARLGDRAQAEDVFQEVFLKAYKNAAKLSDPSSVRSWLLKVTANQCRDVQRSSWWRRVRASLTGTARTDPAPDNEAGAPAGLEPGAPAVDGDPADSALRDDVRAALARAVRRLPPPYREVIVLHYFEDMSTDEIARTLRLRKGTVHSRLHRARRALKDILEGWDLSP